MKGSKTLEELELASLGSGIDGRDGCPTLSGHPLRVSRVALVPEQCVPSGMRLSADAGIGLRFLRVDGGGPVFGLRPDKTHSGNGMCRHGSGPLAL